MPAATFYFGYALIGLSAVLLAQHWHERRLFRAVRDPRDWLFHRLKLQRRTVASALIGVVGAAIALADQVPRTPRAATAYLFGLLIGGALIFLFALADWREMRRRREHEVLELVARKLREASGDGMPQEPSSTAG